MPYFTPLTWGFAAVHRALYRALGGRFVDRFGRWRMLLLTTTGRKSGRKRTVPLQYRRDGKRMIVVGSNWSVERQTDWYWNLLSDPRAEVQAGPRRFPVTAHIATGEERERLWALMVRGYRGYEAYARRMKGIREIPVVVLTPTVGQGSGVEGQGDGGGS